MPAARNSRIFTDGSRPTSIRANSWNCCLRKDSYFFFFIRGMSTSTQFQRAEGDDGAQNAQDIKAHDDLRFVPAHLLKVMVQGRHQKNPLAGPGATPGVFEPG